ERNWDLAGVAMAGAIGDIQHLGGFSGLNAALFEEALARNVLSKERGLALASGPVEEALTRCIVPYFVGISGRPEGARKVLADLKIDPQVPVNELVPDERRRLTSLLATVLLRQGADAEAVEALVKERYWAAADGVFADELSSYVDGCARLGYEAVGLREAASQLGGDGGGHNIASGASIPKGKEEKFLTLVDEIVGRQLAPKPEEP